LAKGYHFVRRLADYILMFMRRKRCVRTHISFLLSLKKMGRWISSSTSILSARVSIYGTPDSTLPELLPIDIVFKENLNP
jgi:hypothetical protein